MRELWTTRDHIARAATSRPAASCPTAAIINAATVDPDTVEKLTALPVFGGSQQRRSAQVWLDALARARTTDRPADDSGTVERAAAGVAVGPAQARGRRAAGGGRAGLTELSQRVSVPTENLRHSRYRAPAVLGLAAGDRGGHRGGDRRVPARSAARQWQRELAVPVLTEALTADGEADAK